MINKQRIAVTLALLLAAGMAWPQDDEADELKIAALEALMTAPPERALPSVTRVLRGDNSVAVKESALFVLSQIDRPEAAGLLLEVASQPGPLQQEAIEMIGIGGDATALAALREIYASGDEEVRGAVLDAYLIAGDEDSVYELAVNASTEEEREAAIEMLGVMDATDRLRDVRAQAGVSEGLIEALALSGDTASLRELALDNSDADLQAEAIQALGIAGGDDANAALLEIYRSSDQRYVREAALEGMLISGYDQGALELYRASDDVSEKRMLLEYLTIMGSDEIWDIIDAALEGQR